MKQPSRAFSNRELRGARMNTVVAATTLPLDPGASAGGGLESLKD
jgi:hypothetical protein